MLWPYWPPDGGSPVPILWPGWTLFYELVFYILFGLGVSRGRVWAVGLAMGGLTALSLIGLVARPENAALFAVTRPLLLMFLPGMVLALWHAQGRTVPEWLRLVALVAFVPVLLAVPPPEDGTLGAVFLLWAGGPALLAFLAVAGGDWQVPGYRVIGPLGHSSYALYLLHVPLAHAWAIAYPGRLFVLGPWVYLASLTACTVVASVLFWRFVEVPLTRWLNVHLARP